MKVAELLEQRRQQWRDLELLCHDLERRRGRRMSGAAIARFASLYRAACADLALADAYQLPHDTIQYLHELVGRSHNQLYRSRMFRWGDWGRELFQRVPARLLGDRALWLAFAVFWGIFGLSMFLARESHDFTRAVVGEAMIVKMESMYKEPVEGRDVNQSAMMAGFYGNHNPSIGLRCFAWGLLLGVGGLFVTVFNAMLLGAVFGHMLTVEQPANFFHFVTAHGPFELTAVVFSAAAGMRMGFALVSTGGLSRMASLQRAATDAMPTVALAVLLFWLAGLIEGFLSPSAAPYAVKAAVALACTAILIFYVVGLGYAGRQRTAT